MTASPRLDAPGGPPHNQNTPRVSPDRHPSILARFVPPRWLKGALFVLALAPAAWGTYAILSDFLAGTRHLGANPIKELEHYLGKWTLRFLLITLAVTPLRQLFGVNWLQKYRRMFGLFAFFYATLHLLTYALLDVQLDWGELLTDIAKRPYITIGMTAFALLIPLAITSTAKMVKRLGGKRWAALHRSIYVIVPLGTIHYYMSVKRDVREPLLFGLILTALLGYRIWKRRARPRAVAR